MSEEHLNLISSHDESSAQKITDDTRTCDEATATVEPAPNDQSCYLAATKRDDSDSSQEKLTASAKLGEQHEPREDLESESAHPKFTLIQARRRRLLKAWWLEAVACATSLTALLALFGVLYHYKNRPSPDWPKWMSLNTILSTFVVVLKTSVLFVLAEGIGQLKWTWFTRSSQPLEHVQMWDDATRGPAGAFVLLGRLRAKDLTASLGALIIILMLAVDPFTQQIIHYNDCAVPVSGSAKLSRANAFSGGGSHTGAGSESIVPGIQNAINAGVYNPNPDTNFECATGNCTWSTAYSTVAWCSACSDISDQLHVTRTDTTTSSSSIASGTNNGYANYSLETSIQDGISIKVSSVGYEYWEFAAMGPAPEHVTDEFPTAPIDFITGAKPPEVCNHTYTERVCRAPMGSRCSLFPCVKTFSASTESGQLTETLVDEGKEWGFGSRSLLAMLDMSCLRSPDEIQSLTDFGYKLENSQRYLAYNLSDDGTQDIFDNPLTSSLIRRDCLYIVTGTFLSSMTYYFLNWLNGNVTGPFPTIVSPPDEFEGPQILQSLFNFGNATFESINETFHNMSVSLTNYMRENGTPVDLNNGTEPINSTPATGITMQYKICIGVRWGWLAYPATLVLLTFIFFGLLLAATWPKSSHATIWKSSPLALLYHGLSSWDQNQLDENELKNLDEAEGMKEMAKTTSVRLAGTADGLVQLVEQRKVTRQPI